MGVGTTTGTIAPAPEQGVFQPARGIDLAANPSSVFSCLVLTTVNHKLVIQGK